MMASMRRPALTHAPLAALVGFGGDALSAESLGSQLFGTAGAAGKNGDGTTTAKVGTAGAIVQFQ
jgi:hypothetical protein